MSLNLVFKGVRNMTAKTAISLDDALLERVDVVARETGLSRSKLFSLSMREYLDRYEHRRILEALNEVYGDSTADIATYEDAALAAHHRARHRRRLEDSW